MADECNFIGDCAYSYTEVYKIGSKVQEEVSELEREVFSRWFDGEMKRLGEQRRTLTPEELSALGAPEGYDPEKIRRARIKWQMEKKNKPPKKIHSIADKLYFAALPAFLAGYEGRIVRIIETFRWHSPRNTEEVRRQLRKFAEAVPVLESDPLIRERFGGTLKDISVLVTDRIAHITQNIPERGRGYNPDHSRGEALLELHLLLQEAKTWVKTKGKQPGQLPRGSLMEHTLILAKHFRLVERGATIEVVRQAIARAKRSRKQPEATMGDTG